MPATKIESIYVRFLGNAASYMVAAAAVQKSLAGISAQAKATSTAMLAVRSVMASGLVGAASLVSFAKMDKAMTQSLAIMGDVADFMKRDMQQAAIDLSLTSSTSMDKLADGYFFLASAGFTASQSLAALDEVNRFAIAGNFDMARATDLLTDAQSALGLTVDDSIQNMMNLTRVSDVLVKANTLANATTLQFSTALTRQAATSMRTFGIEIEQGVAVLAAYADQGIKAELAGTSYDRVLRLLSRSALENADAHKHFGLEVFDANGKMNSMVTITRQLEAAFKGMSTEEKVAALEALGFQARVQQAIFPLIGMSDEIERYENELKAAGGTTEEVADKQLKSFVSQMRIAWNHVKMVGRDIGEILAPKMQFLFDIIKKMTLVWKDWNMGTKKAIINTLLFIGAIAPFVAFFTTLPMWIAGAGFALAKFNAGLVIVGGLFTKAFAALVGIPAAAAAAPFLAVAAAIGTVVAAGVGVMALVTGTWSLGDAWDKVSGFVGNALSSISGFFKNWEGNWPKVKEGLYEFFTDFSNFGQVFRNIGTNIAVFANAFAKSLGALFGWFSEQGLPMAINWGIGFITGILKVLNQAGKIFVKFTLELYKVFRKLAIAMAIVFSDVFTGVIRGMMKLVVHTTKIVAALQNLDFRKAGMLATMAAVDLGTGLVAGAKKAGEAAAQVLEDAFAPLAANFMEGFAMGAVTDDLQQTLQDIWAGAGFVNPLEGTALDDLTLVNRDVSEFVGPMQPAWMQPGFMGPLPAAEMMDDFVGPRRPEDADKEKREEDTWQATKAIEATGIGSAKAAEALLNARVSNMVEEKRIARERKEERIRERQERERKEAEEQARQEQRAQELFGHLRTITEWIGNQAGAVFANFGGS